MLGNPTIAPGIYAGPSLAGLLRPNEQQWLFRNQLVVAGGSLGSSPGLPNANPSASIAVCLGRIQDGYPNGMSLTIFFTDANGVASTPGNFEVDWQNADIDIDANYVTMNSFVNTASLNSSFHGRIELPLFWARYTRIYLKTLTNAVYLSAQVTR